MPPNTVREAGADYILLTDGDWIRTIRQSLPVLRRVLRSLRPTWEMETVAAIETGFLTEAGIRGIIWDVDGTLAHCGAAQLAPEVGDAFSALAADPGLGHVILSNCSEPRFEELSRLFPAIPVVKGYGTESGPLFKVRVGGREEWSGAPRGELRPIRKPDGALIEFALQLLGIEDRRHAVLIGDQYLTDVACANMGGIRSIRVATVGVSTFPFAVRLLQRVDRWLHVVMR